MEDENWLRPEPEMKMCWMLKGIFTILFLWLIGWAWIIFIPEDQAFLIWMIGNVITFIIMIFYVLWVVVMYGRYRFRVDADGVWMKRGIWWTSHRHIPYARVQHTSIDQGPFEKLFGIYNLNVFTAGTGSMGSNAGSRGMFGAEGFLPAIKNPEELREQIMARVKDSGDGLGGKSKATTENISGGSETLEAILSELKGIRKELKK